MKLLVVVDTMGTGGKERRLLELLKGLMLYDHIHCELIILSDIVEYKDLNQLNIPIHFVKRKSKLDFSVFVRLYKIARRFKPDIIQGWSSMVSLFVFPIAKLLQITFVNAMIADAPAYLKPFSPRWIRSHISFPFSDAIIANSKAGLKAYRAPKNRSYCIHNGIDLNRFKHLEAVTKVRERFNIKTKYIVGMVGSFRGAKDYDSFIAAAKHILTQRKDTTFLAIGEGKDLPGFQAELEEEYKDYIIFTGRQGEVESIVNTFSIGVLMTDENVHGEGISNAIIEYMVLEKPVIATDTGGTTELVINGQTGIITPQRDPAKLAEHIQYLLDHQEFAQQMGRAGRERILKHFTLDEMTKGFVDLYHHILRKDPEFKTLASTSSLKQARGD